MSYTILDLAYGVLKEAPSPLTYQEIWEIGVRMGLDAKVRITGKTPWQSLGARLYVDVRDNEASRFIKVGRRPAKFFLKERESQVPQDVDSESEVSPKVKDVRKKAEYKEKDLHPLLTYFVYANPSFNRGRSIYTKTIHHEKSSRSGYNEWVHPDMVGFYIPLEDWQPNVIEFNRLSDNNSLRLFSFELKRVLNRGNYRESFFQAVSNSSWAHEGYLVAAEVAEDDELLAELDRLTSGFGIGVIHLDLSDIDSSRILFPVRPKAALDWETVNKLCEQNSDFDRFLEDVKIDLESKRIHKSEYDEVKQDIEGYIAQKLKV